MGCRVFFRHANGQQDKCQDPGVPRTREAWGKLGFRRISQGWPVSVLRKICSALGMGWRIACGVEGRAEGSEYRSAGACGGVWIA